MTKPITFTTIAGAECRYARHATRPPPAPPYGTIGKGPRKQRLMPEAHAALTSALEELWSIHPFGQARYVVSAGAMVEQSDRRGPNDAHVRGLAYDLDSLWWVEPGYDRRSIPTRKLVTLNAPKNWRHYIAVQCVLARWFGTCLGYDYNAAHRDHWHVDITRPVGFDAGSRMDTVLVQRGLREVWGATDLDVDGKFGPVTWGTWRIVANNPQGDAIDWRYWLLATAKRGLEEV